VDSVPIVTYCNVEGGYGDPADMNIDADPLFVDAPNGDFRLRGSSPGFSGSPCIDAGINGAMDLGTDFEGDQRFFDDIYTTDTGIGTPPIVDMGADEFVDTDGDQMADSWEGDNFGDLSHDGTLDSDVDGLTDLEEFQYGTNPTLWDTDGDYVSDGTEVGNATSPLDQGEFTPAGTGGVRGVITPVTGVQITVYAITGNPCGPWSTIGSGVTDPASGNYAIVGLPPDDYYLYSDNQTNYVREYWTDAGSVRSCNEAVSSTVSDGVMSAGKDFDLELGGSISGTITEEGSGLPIQGLHVGANQIYCMEDWAAVAHTDANGDYTIHGIPAGTVYLKTCGECVGMNYVNEWYNSADGTYYCAQATPISVSAGEELTGYDFILPVGATISGMIYEADGTTPITDPSIHVGARLGNPCYNHEQVSGTNPVSGSYTIQGVPPGDVYLVTHDSQSNYLNEWWTGNPTDSSSYLCDDAQSIPITGSDTVTGKDFQLATNTDTDGDGVPDDYDNCPDVYNPAEDERPSWFYDLRNFKTVLEAYYADYQEHPKYVRMNGTVVEMATCYEPNTWVPFYTVSEEGVILRYLEDNSCQDYDIEVYHSGGSLRYTTSNRTSLIYWLDMNGNPHEIDEQRDYNADEKGDACSDTDNDGVLDIDDPCPLDNPDDLDGDGVCGDGDRFPDADNCPSGPNPMVAYNLGDSIGDCALGDLVWGVGDYWQVDADCDGIGDVDVCDASAAGERPTCGIPNTPPCPPEETITDTDDDQLADDQEPEGCVGLQDCDGDGVIDGEDNCIQVSNLAQTDTDRDGQGDLCDTDDDNDTVADGNDNCPVISNTDQSNIDGDPDGDACDTDIDGDGLLNDEEIGIGTSPTNPDTDGDLICDGHLDPDDLGPIEAGPDPDPLNPATDPKYTIEFALEVANSRISTDSWLPAPPSPYPAPSESEPVLPAVVQSSQVTVVAILKDPAGDPTAFNGDVTFTLNPSTWEGVATNDTEVYTDYPSNDFSFAPGDKEVLDQTVASGPVPEERTVDLYSFDYGGQATITVTAVAPDNSVVQGTITLPLDSDNDLLPNVWEYSIAGFDAFNAHSFGPTLADGQEDTDTSINNQYDGDGLTNFREFRGVILDYPNGDFEKHLRLDPRSKDLFVRGDGFANSVNPPANQIDVLPFSLDYEAVYGVPNGENAFEEAGIVVHDVTERLSFRGPGEPPHIDILVVTNDTENTTTIAGYANGWTNHMGSRYWTWDTKGASYVGNFELYQINEETGAQGTYLYNKNLMHYIYNRPYLDDDEYVYGEDPENPGEIIIIGGRLNPTYIGLLDPLDLVEDYRNENGIGPETFKGKTEDRFIDNEVLDGDHMMVVTDEAGAIISTWKDMPYGTPQQLYQAGVDFSCFDADGDGLVENPPCRASNTVGCTDPLNLNPSAKDDGEYDAYQLQLHTAIHEMGHGVGIAEHTTDKACVMYEDSSDWDRAGFFCDIAKSQILIHNKTE